MTSEFEDFEYNSSTEDQYTELKNSTSDSFELLSAYIDGELSPSEKKQVQAWLDRDAEFKQLYLRLLNLQGQIQNFIIPPAEKSTEEITTGVFQSLDRHRRKRRTLVWGGSAIAASIVATISGIIPGFSTFSPQVAEVNLPNLNSDSVMVAVAIDRPAINIPKSVTGYSLQNLNLD